MSCLDCKTGALLPGEPTGYISTHGAYFAPAPYLNAKDDSFECAILLLTDGFGLSLKNARILADNLAMRLDCDVWVPDYFRGRPFIDVNTMTTSGRARTRICNPIRSMIETLSRLPALIHSRPAIVDARLAKFIDAIQDEKQYTTIGAVGYCYGGSAAIRLASTQKIQSVVICHPGEFTIPQVNAIKVPSAWVCAEGDLSFRKSLRLKAEAAFSKRRGTTASIIYEFEDYQGAMHGFACHPNLADIQLKAAYEKAFEQTVRWFSKTLVF